MIKSLYSIYCLLIYCLCSFVVYGQSPLNTQTDILIVGNTQSGVAAAIQAARMMPDKNIILISEDNWHGGALTRAGVGATDGNELLPWMSGIWGELLNRIVKYEYNFLKYGWVSLYSFRPNIARKAIDDWIKEYPNIKVLTGYHPVKVLLNSDKQYKRITGVIFNKQLTINALMTIDATELGEIINLSGIDYRIGWEYQGEFDEPSAPVSLNSKKELINRYPIQESTWVFYLKDYQYYNQEIKAKRIPKPVGYTFEKAAERYWCAFENPKLKNNKYWATRYALLSLHKRVFSPESFLTYGQMAPDIFMINWPICGNDYSINIERLFDKDKAESDRFLREAHTYSHWFARYIQDSLGRDRFGLSAETFPANQYNYNLPGFAYQPYIRESRRIAGLQTFDENNALSSITHKDSIAIGNYANDHHYYELASKKHKNNLQFKVQPKSEKWGGRYTGTPFTIPMGALIPSTLDGLVVAEKSISVSHIANGVTRLQPVVINIGQAAGALAAYSVLNNIQPFEVSPKAIQNILNNDKYSPMSTNIQDAYEFDSKSYLSNIYKSLEVYCGDVIVSNKNENFKLVNLSKRYTQAVTRETPYTSNTARSAGLVTNNPETYKYLQTQIVKGEKICVLGQYNHSGAWILAWDIIK